MLKKMFWGAVALLMIFAAGALYWANSVPALAALNAEDMPAFSDDAIAQGELLAQVGDCAACHTVADGADFAGGLGLPTPFGTIYSTNITPDLDTGIGTWTLAAFDRAMRQGVDRDGNHLYPAFPYDHFTKTADADLEALYAYLMTRDPVVADRHPNDLKFPFSYRPLLAGWKLLFLDDTPFAPDPNLDDEQNRGAYLAASLGHCSACHSPRNLLGAVISDQPLAGGMAEGWIAPPLGPHSISPVAWTVDDYADYLFDGWSENHGIAAGPMTSVADHLYNADEDDVFAIASWLAAITPAQADADRDAALTTALALDWPATEGEVFSEDITDPTLSAGRDVFARSCAKCHRERVSESQPISLGLTYAINGPTPTNLFNVIQNGIVPPYGVSTRKMQAIELNDADMASVAAYVRWHFTDNPAWQDLPSAAVAHRESTLAAQH